MIESSTPFLLVVWGGALLAFAFGAVASMTNYCTMGAISDVVNMGHWGRMRMWLLTIAVAIVGTQALHYLDLIDLSKSLYQRPVLPWASLLWGGFLFGIGMTVAAGCTNKNLVRLGGGSLRSLVVLAFLAISGYMTLKGLFAQWRVNSIDRLTLDLTAFQLGTQGLVEMFGKLTGLAPKTAQLALTSVLGLGLLGFVFKDKRFRGNGLQVVGSALLGAIVVAAWYLTGHLGHGENPETLETVYFATNSRTLESLSFVAPIAYLLEWLMLWTDKSLHLSFGVATVLGVVAGAFAHAVATRTFRWEGFASLEDLRTQLIGAMLMGYGGVSAMGCTIGQGLSGLSTLSLGSLIALAGIVAGAVLTMKWQAR